MTTKATTLQKLLPFCSVMCCLIALYFLGHTYYVLFVKGLNLDEATTIAVLDRESLLISIVNTVKNIHSGWLYPLFIFPLLNKFFVQYNEPILRVSSLLFILAFVYRSARFAQNFGLTKIESYYLGLLLLSMPGIFSTATVVRPYAIASYLSILSIEIQWWLVKRKSYKFFLFLPLAILLIFLFHPLYAISFGLCSLVLLLYKSPINLQSFLKERLRFVLCAGALFLIGATPLFMTLLKRIALVNASGVYTSNLPDLFFVWEAGRSACLSMVFLLIYGVLSKLIRSRQADLKNLEAIAHYKNFKVAAFCWISVPIMYWIIHTYLDIPINYFRYMNLPSVFLLTTLLLSTHIIKSHLLRQYFLLIVLLYSTWDSAFSTRILLKDDTRKVQQFIGQLNDSSIPILISTGHIESVSEDYILDVDHQAVNTAPLKAYGVLNPSMALPFRPADLNTMSRYQSKLKSFIAHTEGSNFIVIGNEPEEWVSTMSELFGVSCHVIADLIRFSAITCSKATL